MFRTPSVLVFALVVACDYADEKPIEAAGARPAPSTERAPPKPSKHPKPDPSRVIVHVASGSNVTATDAAAIAKVMRPALATCTAPEVDEAPTVELSVNADAAGKVRSAKASSKAKLPSEFLACLERRARAPYFPISESGAAVKLRVQFESR